jgi:hypothetical protein
MSDNIWESQLEINTIFDKRLGMIEEQLTLLTQLTIEMSQVSRKLAQPTEPTEPTEPKEPTGCTGKHCACQDGAM